ncbi:MAG: sigma-70 family RNA polymerase sigma factor [Clostridiales bacterium]|nr:sigma-70 family RNA polymerase sigma factor [Clostridiales bacterium]
MTDNELEKIYNEAYRAVYWTAMSFLKNEADAEDIVQDSFISFIKNYSEMDDTGKATALLKKIAANKCLDRIKLTKTDIADEEFFENIEAVPEDFLPDSIIESSEMRKIIMDIIENSLSEDIRRTLILFYFDEMSTKEIAEALGVPEGTVRWRLNFARNKIKKEVEKYEKDNDTKLFGMAALPFLSKLFIKEAEQVPFKAMPASFIKILSASTKAPAKGAATKIAASAAKKGTGIIMNKFLIGSVIGVIAVGTIAGTTIVVLNKNGDTAPTKVEREYVDENEDDDDREDVVDREEIIDREDDEDQGNGVVTDKPETEDEALPEGVLTSEQMANFEAEPPAEWLEGEYVDCYSCPEFTLSAKRFYVTYTFSHYYYTAPVLIWKLDNLTDSCLAVGSDGFQTEFGDTSGLNDSFHFEIGPHETQYSVHRIASGESVSPDGINIYSYIDYVSTDFNAYYCSYDDDGRFHLGDRFLQNEQLYVDFTAINPDA